jgi:hypothetical protein
MKRLGLCLAFLSLATFALILEGESMPPTSGPAASSAPAGQGEIEAVYKSITDWLGAYQAGKGLAEMAPLAEKIADRLIAGGNLYIAGDPGFADELNFRAGGLGGATPWIDQKITDKDVLIIGLLDPSSKGARYLAPSWIGQNRGNLAPALTVHIASQRWPQAARLTKIVNPSEWPSGLYFLDTGAPEGGSWPAVAAGQVATTTVANVLQGEIAAAITRKGKTPAILASLAEPNGSEFDAKIKGKNVIDEPKLQPIPAGQIGGAFLQACRDMLVGYMQDGHAKELREAAGRIARCQMSKGVILSVGSVHILARGLTVPQSLTQVFLYGASYQWTPPQGLGKGDVLLFFGYMGYPQGVVSTMTKAQAEVVVVSAKAGTPTEGVTYVPGGWQADATVEMPGYPYKALAISGITQPAQWYAMMAEAEAMCRAAEPKK